MLTELYIESLLVDEELADLVWEAWHDGEIDDETASARWIAIQYSTEGHGEVAELVY
jgi:hypothetical protein